MLNGRTRIVLGVGACAISVLYAIFAASTARPLPPDPYSAAWAAGRFREIPNIVPPGTRLGYLTDIPRDIPDRVTFFNTVRYAVAPALLLDDPARRRVIGDFRRTADPKHILAREGLTVERDLGGGALLLGRYAP